VNTALRVTTLLLISLGAAALVWANSSDPPIGHTGAPGEPTCAQVGCHDQYPLNSGPGAAELPDWLFWMYPVGTCPDDTTVVPIMVRQPGATRWGFELTVAGESGEPYGQFYITDSARTDITQGYVFQTEAGTDTGNTDSSLGWTVGWTYVDVPGAGHMRAYLAGVAADNDGTPLGDYVYTDSADIWISIVDPYCDIAGDFNLSSTVTSSDIIAMVNLVFKSGPHHPHGDMYEDANCNGSVTAADVIVLVNYVFKGACCLCEPCSQCCMLDLLIWSCP
jgi:hypothetical protein